MIIFTFDVLAHPAQQVGERQPSLEGRQLWQVFKTGHSSTVVIIADGRDNREHVASWLKGEGLKPDLLDYAEDNSARAKYERVSALRASLGHCHWFLDTDPGSVASALDEGIPSLLVLTPLVARPDWRLRTRQSWGDLVERVQTERMKRLESFRDDDE